MKKYLKIIMMIAFILLGIVLYARFVGTIGLITKEYTINDSYLPNSYNGLKIVHFSDIHYKRAINIKKIESIVNEINLINPDIVVFTGDLIDKDQDLTKDEFKELASVLKKIKAKYGKYTVLGNHDYNQLDEVINTWTDAEFKYLDNSYDIVYNINKEKIFIGGLGNVTYNDHDIDKTLEYFNDVENTEYKIILTHEPDITDTLLENYSINLILAGHSHNGQIILPFIGPVYTPPYAKNYYKEHYKINDTNLYISSGIGVSTVNYRLNNHPSINFYRLKNKNTD